MIKTRDTIAAIATAPGKGGVGVIRISGDKALTIAEAITHKTATARQAHYRRFFDQEGNVLDHGILLFFPGPNSFTGEDVIELQGHGGPVILDLILQRVLALGARIARPGEFSERAFLNNKIDLAQAEAIADLINAQSQQSAKLAMRSLDGQFSQQIHTLVEKLIYLRMYVEAAIDFPEEEIDFLSDGKVQKLTQDLQHHFVELLRACQHGSVLREGIHVVIAGKPNAGKSSLLNALCGRDSAIVTDIPGTTRDLLREHIVLDGLPIHLIDTAGLREAHDRVEQIGIERAQQAIQQADVILLVVDASTTTESDPKTLWPLPSALPAKDIIVVHNKIDQTTRRAGKLSHQHIALSAQSGEGLNDLIALLKQHAGLGNNDESLFLARRRHIDAIQHAQDHVETGLNELQKRRAGELLAENLRLAQQHLNEITGEFSSDDLLGRIFSSFCIGK